MPARGNTLEARELYDVLKFSRHQHPGLQPGSGGCRKKGKVPQPYPEPDRREQGGHFNSVMQNLCGRHEQTGADPLLTRTFSGL